MTTGDFVISGVMNFEKAKNDFLKCLQLGDENPRYYYFAGPLLNEIQSWKKALKKAVGKNDTIRAIKICSDLLDINPLAGDILDIRASLYEIEGDTTAAKRDRKKLRDMQRVRFRYNMDELREKH